MPKYNRKIWFRLLGYFGETIKVYKNEKILKNENKVISGEWAFNKNLIYCCWLHV
jgi:hypothetical protein